MNTLKVCISRIVASLYQCLKTCLHQLLEQCRQWQRPAAGEAAAAHKEHPINPDGALLVRFLAQKGLDEERA